jgi:phospholipid transport system transporter-binding protein
VIRRAERRIVVESPMTMETARQLFFAGGALLGEDGAWEVDLAEVTRVDSAALAVLCAWQRLARAQGENLTLRAVPEDLRALAGLYGLSSLLAQDQG